MKLTISTKIKYEDLGSSSVLTNDLVGVASSATNKFKIKRAESKNIYIKYGESFSANIFDLLNITKERLVYLHIYLYDTNTDNIQLNDLKFALSIGDNQIGKLSQFQMANLKGFVDDITIDSIELNTTTTEAILVILAGEE